MIDVVFLFVLTVALPIMGRIETRRLEKAVAASKPDVRVGFYRGTVLLQWGLVAALLLYWWSQGPNNQERPLPAG